MLAAAKSLQSCPTLCDPIDVSPPGSPAPGILQARTLEWVYAGFDVLFMCKILHISIDNAPGILQARTLEWVCAGFDVLFMCKILYISIDNEF